MNRKRKKTKKREKHFSRSTTVAMRIDEEKNRRREGKKRNNIFVIFTARAHTYTFNRQYVSNSEVVKSNHFCFQYSHGVFPPRRHLAFTAVMRLSEENDCSRLLCVERKTNQRRGRRERVVRS